jgi:thiamine pyrophosphokinase
MKDINSRIICIIANGEVPSREATALAMRGVGKVIAADGGSVICHKLGIIPDIITGDLDSSPPDILRSFGSAKIILDHDQEHSDMEKALRLAAEMNPERINILSGFGGRTDHLLANLLVFYHLDRYLPWDTIELRFYDNWGTIRFLSAGIHFLNNRRGKTVSFFSLGDLENLSLQGFRFNINRENQADYFIGLSNVYESDHCLVEFSGGKLIYYECYNEGGAKLDES